MPATTDPLTEEHGAKLVTFIARRLVAGFFVVLGASFIAFVLVANSGDPRESALALPVSRRQLRLDFLENALHLSDPVYLRFLRWLDGIKGCFVGNCDLGVYIRDAVSGRAVSDDIGRYLLVSLKLVTAATVLAIVVGVAIGIVTALRQYSGFDYGITLMTFVFFSLPVFWVGILLKDAIAIKFNNFLQAGPTFTVGWIVGLALFFAIVCGSILTGPWPRRLMIAAGVGVATGLLAFYISATHWLLNPQLGIFVIALLAIAIAFGMTALTSGLNHRRSLVSALITAVIGVASYYPVLIFVRTDMTFGKLMLLLAIAIAVGIVVGLVVGGDDRRLNARNGALTAFGIAVIIFIDRMMRTWQVYSAQVRGRPLATTGDSTPNIRGDFWIHAMDTFTHLLLPTITLMLISLAGHSRYARASMLEVLNQDYVRTARAKGLTERTVIMRHAFRNALIPLTTIIAFDIGGLLGGAVVTETVYGWKSLGRMFSEALTARDPAPLMAVFLVLAIVAVVFNMLADIVYGLLDPRIRVTSK